MKYLVMKKEVYLQGYYVEANTPEEAEEIVSQGEGEFDPDELYYHDTPENSIFSIHSVS